VLPQLLVNACYVPDSELEQEERSSYVPYCDITANDEVQENDDAAEIEEAQLIGDGDEDLNKMLVTSSEFTDLPTLSGPDNADSLMQIHTHIHQSLSKVQDAEQDTLDRTTYKIQSNKEHKFYISVCHGSKFLKWFKDDDFFPACFPTLFPYGTGGPRLSSQETEDGRHKNFSLKTWAGMLL
jgi:hypothetical protein